MKETNRKSSAVSGVAAPPPRPTPLGAAVVASIITFPIGVTLVIMDLLLL